MLRYVPAIPEEYTTRPLSSVKITRGIYVAAHPATPRVRYLQLEQPGVYSLWCVPAPPVASALVRLEEAVDTS